MGIFNAGSGIGHSINDIVSIILDITQKKPEIIYKPNRSFDVKKSILDISLTKKQLNWKPYTNIVDGVQAHWEWVNKNLI